MSTPVRILHIVTHMNRGGLETMIMNYYRHIDRKRIQFDFLVHRDQEADYDSEIRSLGGIIYRIPPLNPFSRNYLTALDSFFATHSEYKIVHCHLDCMAGIPLKYAKKHNVPVRIAHAHTCSQDKDAKYFLKLLYKRNIHHYATDLFACGAQAGQWMFRTHDFTILNNAIDAASYVFQTNVRQSMRNGLGIVENILVIGHVGRFSPPKNHRFLLQVFACIARTTPSAKLLLVGDGSLRGSIEQQANALGIRDQIIFTGVRSDIPQLLQAMDVFLFPSLYEGLSIAIIEAQAAGLPCLISDSIPEECKKTELVHLLPLSQSADIWAQELLRIRSLPRKNTLAEIQSAGFDIQENTLWLQNYYLSHYPR